MDPVFEVGVNSAGASKAFAGLDWLSGLGLTAELERQLRNHSLAVQRVVVGKDLKTLSEGFAKGFGGREE